MDTSTSSAPAPGPGKVPRTILWIAFWGTFVAAFLPVLANLVPLWAHSDDYSHCFAIVPLSLYLLARKRDALRVAPAGGDLSGLPVALCSLALYAVAHEAEMQTLASVCMILFLWGAVIFLFGWAVFRICLFPLLLLFFMIPVPSQWLASLTIPLQLMVTRASVFLASLTGMPIYHEGNIINLPGGGFEVVQACSGLRSIMTLLTMGTVLAYLMLRSNALRVTLVALGIPIAIAVNVLRVFVLVAAFHFVDVDLTRGTVHTLLGLAVFCLALGLFVLAGRGLKLCQR